MSDTLINIRFGAYHFQLSKDWRVYWIYNQYHSKKNRKWDFKWFVVYEFPGLNKFLNN